MREPSQDVARLRAELTELRRQARDQERHGQRTTQLQRALQGVRRAQDAGETPTLRAAQDDVERLVDRYRRALRRLHELTVRLDKLCAEGHADLIDATPSVSVARAQVAAQREAVRDLLRDHLPDALATPAAPATREELEA
jgi:DNA repair exonuclease SbcCD ATPase subunit